MAEPSLVWKPLEAGDVVNAQPVSPLDADASLKDAVGKINEIITKGKTVGVFA